MNFKAHDCQRGCIYGNRMQYIYFDRALSVYQKGILKDDLRINLKKIVNTSKFEQGILLRINVFDVLLAQRAQE